MLIPSTRYTKADLAHWQRCERIDLATAKRARMQCLEDEAVACVLRFLEASPAKEDGAPACVANLSCGKDSTVLVGVLRALWRRHGITLPLVYVRVIPHENPDNALVVEALRATCPEVMARLDTIDVVCERDLATGEWIGTGRLRQGFDEAAARHGERRITGIRAEESNDRRRRHAIAWVWERMAGLVTDGTTTRFTCAPLTAWTGDDVFAYLAREGLPVHPTYACTMGGKLDRRRLRVATLGGSRGGGHRTAHELLYYHEEMRALGFDQRSRS